MNYAYLVPLMLYFVGLKTPTGLMNDYFDTLLKTDPWPAKPARIVLYISEYQRGDRTEQELRSLIWDVFTGKDFLVERREKKLSYPGS